MPSQVTQKVVSANGLSRQGTAVVAYGPNSIAALTRPTNDTLEVPSTDYWASKLGNRLDDVNYYNGLAPSGV